MTAVGVLLNDWDLAVCDVTAKQRTEQWNVGADYRTGNRVTNYDENLYGCKGELAVAKALSLYWQGMDSLLEADRAGDVGEYQVKSTLHNDGHLIFQECHKMGQKTVLAIVGTNKVRLAGWAFFDHAKRLIATGIGRKEKRRPTENHWCYWLPQHALEGMEWLPIVYGPEVVQL